MAVSQKCRGLSAVVSVLLSGLTYLFVGLRALAGVFSVGSVVQYVGAIGQFTTGLIGLSSAVTELRKRSRFYEYYFAVLDAKPTEHRGACRCG